MRKLFVLRRTLAAAAVIALSCATVAQAQPKSPAEAMGAHFRTIDSHGVKLRVAEMGKGPLVILVHGWPESWYSWRHQIPALAKAGYHVVAPDMRGFGHSDKPPNIDDYNVLHTTGDLVSITDAMGEKQAVLVGHDWGAGVVWNAILLHPDRFRAVVAMSVPYRGHAATSPLETTKKKYGDNFWYTLYFQKPGVAEKEFEVDPAKTLRRIYVLYGGHGTPISPPEYTDPKAGNVGWLPRIGEPKVLPAWLKQADLDYYASEFKYAGFRGGINYYRNSNRNWELTPQLAGVKVAHPALFIAGQDDPVIRGETAQSLTTMMKATNTDLRGVTVIPNAGHWIQQERPAEVNKMVLDFLAGLKK
jgi:pimeloyl-ACP methyl ester carboxylesterase